MSVADILQEMARNAGRTPLARGALIGNTIANASLVPGQILNDHENQTIVDAQRARLAAQDARGVAQDARQAAADQRDQTKEQKAEQERQDRGAIMTAGLDTTGPTPQFKFEPAVAEAMKRGRTDLAKELIDAHDKTKRDTAPKTQAELAADAADPKSPTQAQSATALDLMRPPKAEPVPKALESKQVLLDGKPALVNFNPSNGAHTLPDGTDVSTRVRPIPAAAITIHNDQKNGVPGDFTKTGDEFLATIPAQWRATVKKIANYDEDPTKVASMRGGNREMLTQWVNQVNPAYDAGLFTNRAPTRKAFTTGKQGQEITAMNTAIGHLDQLTGLVDKLGNGAFTPGNKVWNSVQTIFGSDKVTNFDTLKDVLASEVAKTLSGGVATVDGIKEQRAKMNGYSSPDQLAGYVKTVIPTMGSKLAAHNFTYHQAMGENDSWSALSPASKAILTKFGFDPEHPEISGNGAAAPVEGATKPIDGFPGTEQTFKNGKWIRTK